MRALYVGNVWGRRNAMWTSSIARPRGLLMLRGSRGCVPHLVLIWTKIGVSGILVCKRAFGSAKHVTLAVYLLFELTATYAYVC